MGGFFYAFGAQEGGNMTKRPRSQLEIGGLLLGLGIAATGPEGGFFSAFGAQEGGKHDQKAPISTRD